MHLDLIDGRDDVGLGEETLQVLGHEVGYADSAHLPLGEERLQAFVSLDRQVEPGRHRLVQDEQVDALDAELAGGLVEGVASGVDLVLLQVSLTALAKVAHGREAVVGRDDLADLYRRYLWVVLDGIRPDRTDATPLPVPSLTTQQAHLMLGARSDDP